MDRDQLAAREQGRPQGAPSFTGQERRGRYPIAGGSPGRGSHHHRNIVQVFDFGYIDTGQPFIVMELLRGESLGERIAAWDDCPPS